MQIYLGLRNYVGNLLRMGFTEDDVAGGGSDRLVDAIVAWGDPAMVAMRIHDHHIRRVDEDGRVRVDFGLSAGLRQVNAFGDLHDVTAMAKLLYIFFQNDFHE